MLNLPAANDDCASDTDSMLHFLHQFPIEASHTPEPVGRVCYDDGELKP
jgi:hypothetical protein